MTVAAVTAVLAGAVVWAVLAGAVVAWLLAAGVAARGRLPGPAAVAGWFLQCWLGRFLLLGAWAGAGWHVFCQRP